MTTQKNNSNNNSKNNSLTLNYCLPVGARLDKIELTVNLHELDADALSELGIMTADGKINLTSAWIPHFGSFKSFNSFKDGNRYSKLQLHVSGDLAAGDSNLIGFSPEEYRNVFVEVTDKLCDWGIVIDDTKADISSMEIQRTFELLKDYKNYHRVFKKLIKAIPRKKYVQYESSYFTINKTKSKYVQYKIYDKSSQLKLSLERDIMRMEVKIKGISNVKSLFGTCDLFQIGQKDIDRVFDELIEKNIIKRLRKLDELRDKDILKLLKANKKTDPHWISASLLQIANMEISDDMPYLLDIEELIPLIDSMDIPRKDRAKRLFRERARDKFNAICQGDDRKMREILQKLTENSSGCSRNEQHPPADSSGDADATV